MASRTFNRAVRLADALLAGATITITPAEGRAYELRVSGTPDLYGLRILSARYCDGSRGQVCIPRVFASRVNATDAVYGALRAGDSVAVG
jgi:hypothetical protein